MRNAKIVLLICFALNIISCSNNDNKNPVGPSADQFEFKWLSTSGSKIVDSYGNQVVLHGVNRSGLEYDQKGNSMSQAEFDFICQNWQAKIIRLP